MKLVEISEAASVKLKSENPSVSSSHCFSSTEKRIFGKGSTFNSKEVNALPFASSEATKQFALFLFSIRTNIFWVSVTE
ncbi:MAG: Uncharacterised protein [Cryomorphaceae bacterium]|nr:MAG: Uncharacterised protein [Cryomorphaceae bacterium]